MEGKNILKFFQSQRDCVIQPIRAQNQAGGLSAISRRSRSLRRHHRTQTPKMNSIPEGCQPQPMQRTGKTESWQDRMMTIPMILPIPPYICPPMNTNPHESRSSRLFHATIDFFPRGRRGDNSQRLRINSPNCIDRSVAHVWTRIGQQHLQSWHGSLAVGSHRCEPVNNTGGYPLLAWPVGQCRQKRRQAQVTERRQGIHCSSSNLPFVGACHQAGQFRDRYRGVRTKRFESVHGPLRSRKQIVLKTPTKFGVEICIKVILPSWLFVKNPLQEVRDGIGSNRSNGHPFGIGGTPESYGFTSDLLHPLTQPLPPIFRLPLRPGQQNDPANHNSEANQGQINASLSHGLTILRSRTGDARGEYLNRVSRIFFAVSAEKSIFDHNHATGIDTSENHRRHLPDSGIRIVDEVGQCGSRRPSVCSHFADPHHDGASYFRWSICQGRQQYRKRTITQASQRNRCLPSTDLSCWVVQKPHQFGDRSIRVCTHPAHELRRGNVKLKFPNPGTEELLEHLRIPLVKSDLPRGWFVADPPDEIRKRIRSSVADRFVALSRFFPPSTHPLTQFLPPILRLPLRPGQQNDPANHDSEGNQYQINASLSHGSTIMPPLAREASRNTPNEERTGSPRYSRLAIGVTLVAQTASLLYRRLPTGRHTSPRNASHNSRLNKMKLHPIITTSTPRQTSTAAKRIWARKRTPRWWLRQSTQIRRPSEERTGD